MVKINCQDKILIQEGFTFVSEQKQSRASEQGFTLLEILISTAVVGILMVVSSAIFINTISSNNKANIVNEAKENASLVTDTLERDVRRASGTVTVTTTDALSPNDTLTVNILGTPITWRCHREVSGNNGYISRNGRTVTNRDPSSGVSWSTCLFSASGSTDNYLVKLDFTLTEGALSHGLGQNLRVTVNHQVSVSTRGF
ncbi:MAG TPA: type II secretion system protein [Candidatus Nanoarchaeia archaeon]|nr:hypothetical protein [uncultured archaeon]